MNKFHEISDVRFRGDIFVLSIDGVEREFSLQKISSKLHKANDQERMNFRISPAGYGIHWPILDEDISIDGLLGISHHPSRKSELTA